MASPEVAVGTLALFAAERATLERELAETRAAADALRVERAEEVAAWLAGRSAACALYRRRIDDARRALRALEDHRRRTERELDGGATALPGMDQMRRGAALAAEARQAEALRLRLAELESIVGRITPDVES